MRSSSPKGIGLLAIVLTLAVAPGAAGEAIVPPSNSGAAQYTETFPTTGGDRETDKVDKGSGLRLDGQTKKNLEGQGPAGHAVAEIVERTAPQHAVGSDPDGNGGSIPAGNGASVPGDSANTLSANTNPSPAMGGAENQPSASADDGSSGLGEIVSEATGSSSSGSLGLLLPLLIGAAFVWALAYLLRHRRRVE